MRLIIYTNILTPYRIYFFDILNNICEKNNVFFKVLVMAETEIGRNWTYEKYKRNYTLLLSNKTLKFKNIEIHFNKNLLNYIKKFNPTHIVCAGSYLCPGVKIILSNKQKLNYKVYFWSESHLNETRKYSLIKLKVRDIIRNYIYKKFDGFWYAGKQSLKFIKKYANENFDSIFIPNLVNNNIFDYHNTLENDIKKMIKKYSLEDRKLTFICPARLIPVKGIDKFLKAIANNHNRKNITIIIPGEGFLKEQIMKIADTYGIDVRILGYLNQNELSILYSIADVFLMPSISDANPLTCIEALWEGLPLLVSKNVGNYPEVISEGKNGFVFDYSNVKELESIIDNFLNWSEDDFKKAKEFSYSLACRNYRAEDVALKIVSKYKGIMELYEN